MDFSTTKKACSWRQWLLETEPPAIELQNRLEASAIRQFSFDLCSERRYRFPEDIRVNHLGRSLAAHAVILEDRPAAGVVDWLGVQLGKG